MPKTFVVGDIHGAYRALQQCLARSSFDYTRDHLISLGDVCDGWPETKQSIDELLRVKNLTYVLGNHDHWALEWMKNGFQGDTWLAQGGTATVASYAGPVPESHIRFLSGALPYYIHKNKLFVHAGIDPAIPVEKQGIDTFLWDRSLGQLTLESFFRESVGKITDFDEVYIGHTPVPYQKPLHACEVWMMDTGAGWSGVLSMMNITTKEIFTSDPVPGLYPGINGRKKF